MEPAAVEAALRDARTTAARAVERELAHDLSGALDDYASATEQHLAVARAGVPQADEVRNMAMRLLTRAEKIKQRLQADKGTDALQQARDAAPVRNEDLRALSADAASVPGVNTPALSAAQRAVGASLKPPCSSDVLCNRERLLQEPTIFQGAATDCSLVAALQVLTTYDAQFGTELALTRISQRDAEDVYAVVLWYNGAQRTQLLDGLLPRGSDGELLCATTSDGQLWPGLVEKAYLSAMGGGYAYGGSDAGHDLYMLLGWIPERIELNDRSFQREKTWIRLHAAWTRGDCMLTVGTSADPENIRYSALRYLAPSHCYAVVRLEEHGMHRAVTLVNPWRSASEERVTTCSWDELCDSMDTLCASWRPTLFAHAATAHGTWRMASHGNHALDAARSEQHLLELERDAPEAWVLLERHVGERPEDADDASEYIAVHAFPSTDAARRINVDTGGLRSVYVDARHTLLRIAPAAASRYTLVASAHYRGASSGTEAAVPPPASVRYTLTALADVPVRLASLPHSWPHRAELRGALRGRSAGGNMEYATFRHNPQFRIEVRDSAHLDLPRLRALVTLTADVPTQLLLVRGQGERVAHVAPRDVIASSGAYTRGIALCDAHALQPGTYTLVVSCYAPGQAADFALALECSAPLYAAAVPPEGAGMFHRTQSGMLFGKDCAWTLDVPHQARLDVRLAGAERRPPPLVLEVLAGAARIATAHSAGAAGAALRTLNLPRGEYRVCARYAGTAQAGTTAVSLDVYSVHPIHVRVAT